jgi:ABC-type multidrug transport system fused ATPase/permease subunit
MFHSHIFHNLTFKIESGEFVGLIGPSGSGKTTLINILLGLFEPSEGQIFYNGTEVKNNITFNWRSQIAHIPQDMFFINDTVRNNVALGIENNNIEDKRVVESLEKANFFDSLNGMKDDNIKKVISENGMNFSGGQRQRIALARAFYFNRKIIILDEATNSLDSKTEEKILNELQVLKNKITLLLISHSPKPIKYCDRVYEIKNKEIFEI